MQGNDMEKLSTLSEHGIFTVAGYGLDPAGPVRREPTRAPADQEDTFSSRFDYHTLFYDAFF